MTNATIPTLDTFNPDGWNILPSDEGVSVLYSASKPVKVCRSATSASPHLLQLFTAVEAAVGAELLSWVAVEFEPGDAPGEEVAPIVLMEDAAAKEGWAPTHELSGALLGEDPKTWRVMLMEDVQDGKRNAFTAAEFYYEDEAAWVRVGETWLHRDTVLVPLQVRELAQPIVS